MAGTKTSRDPLAQEATRLQRPDMAAFARKSERHRAVLEAELLRRRERMLKTHESILREADQVASGSNGSGN